MRVWELRVIRRDAYLFTVEADGEIVRGKDDPEHVPTGDFRLRAEVSKTPTHLCRHWRQYGDGRADEIFRTGKIGIDGAELVNACPQFRYPSAKC